MNPNTCFLTFTSDFNPNTADPLIAKCTELAQQGVQSVCLLLSTMGGQVASGISVYNILRALPIELTTYNVGSVNSIGNVVFLAGSKRYSVPHATFMFHGVGFDVVQPMRFEEKLLRERLDSIQADQKKIASIIADRTSFPDEEEVSDLFLQAATHDPTFALKKGIIHEIRDLQIPPGAPVFPFVFQR